MKSAAVIVALFGAVLSAQASPARARRNGDTDAVASYILNGSSCFRQCFPKLGLGESDVVPFCRKIIEDGSPLTKSINDCVVATCNAEELEDATDSLGLVVVSCVLAVQDSASASAAESAATTEVTASSTDAPTSAATTSATATSTVVQLTTATTAATSAKATSIGAPKTQSVSVLNTSGAESSIAAAAALAAAVIIFA